MKINLERRLGDRVDFEDFLRDFDLDDEWRSWSLVLPGGESCRRDGLQKNFDYLLKINN